MTNTSMPDLVVGVTPLATDYILTRQGADTADKRITWTQALTYLRGSVFGGALNLTAPVVLSTTTGIDGKTVANTSLYTVPTGKTAIITGYVTRCTAATAITVGVSAGIGNIAGTNNIFASGASGITTTSQIFGNSLSGTSILTPAAGVIYYNLGTAATGTSQTLSVDLIGYLI